MGVETNPEECMSLMHLDQLQELRQQSVMRKKRLKVVVEFAPFNFSSRIEFGQENREYAEDGNSFKVQKYIDVLEWMYAPPKSRTSKPSGKPNKLIYVNCSSITGGDLLSDYEGYKEATLGISFDKKIGDSMLMGKVEFAVRQLKDYLEDLENSDDFKNIYNCGSIKLYISAYFPVDILVFAFQKALGFSIEDKIREEGLAMGNEGVNADEVFRYDLYGGFIDKVQNNANLKLMAEWFEKHCWKFHIESCEVHQVYDMSGTFLTEKGKYEKKTGEILRLMSELQIPTKEFVSAYDEGDRIFGDKDFSKYENYVNSWKSKKKETVYERRLLSDEWTRYDGRWFDRGYDVEFEIEFPALEYERKYYSYFGLRDLLSKEHRKYKAKIEKANNRSELEKQTRAELEQIDKEENAYNDRVEKQRAELQKKREVLNKRRVQDSPEQKDWQQSYDESHSYSSSSESRNDREVIEFEGEMLNEIQLLQKELSILNLQMEKWKKFSERRRKAYDQLKQLLKADMETYLTVIQLCAAGVSVLLCFIAPPVGVLVGSVLCSAVSIKCEFMKWNNEGWSDEKFGEHMFSISLDVISIGFAPVLYFMSKTTKLVQATQTAGHLVEASAKGGGAVNATVKTTGGVNAANKIGGSTNAALKTEEGANAANKFGGGAKAAGTVDDVVITVEEMEKANSMGKLGKTTEGVVDAAGDLGKTGKVTGEAADAAGDLGKTGKVTGEAADATGDLGKTGKVTGETTGTIVGKASGEVATTAEDVGKAGGLTGNVAGTAAGETERATVTVVKEGETTGTIVGEATGEVATTEGIVFRSGKVAGTAAGETEWATARVVKEGETTAKGGETTAKGGETTGTIVAGEYVEKEGTSTGRFLDVAETDTQKFTAETGKIIDSPVDLSKSKAARRSSVGKADEVETTAEATGDLGKTEKTAETGRVVNTAETGGAVTVEGIDAKAIQNLEKIERKVFEISPDSYKELTKVNPSVSNKLGPASLDYFERLSRLQKFVQEGKYSKLFNSGFSKAVTFSGEDLFKPHLSRLMNAFGFSEAFNLLKTQKMIGVTIPKYSVIARAYIIINTPAAVGRAYSLANGLFCVVDRELNPEFNSEYAEKVDQQYLMEMRDRILEGKNEQIGGEEEFYY